MSKVTMTIEFESVVAAAIALAQISGEVTTSDSENDTEVSAPTARKPRKKKVASKKKVVEKEPEPETQEPDEDPFGLGEPAEQPTIDDVRAVLIELQNVVGTENAKALLTRQGADTLKGLDPANYQKVIDDARTELDT